MQNAFSDNQFSVTPGEYEDPIKLRLLQDQTSNILASQLSQLDISEENLDEEVRSLLSGSNEEDLEDEDRGFLRSLRAAQALVRKRVLLEHRIKVREAEIQVEAVERARRAQKPSSSIDDLQCQLKEGLLESGYPTIEALFEGISAYETQRDRFTKQNRPGKAAEVQAKIDNLTQLRDLHLKIQSILPKMSFSSQDIIDYQGDSIESLQIKLQDLLKEEELKESMIEEELQACQEDLRSMNAGKDFDAKCKDMKKLEFMSALKTLILKKSSPKPKSGPSNTLSSLLKKHDMEGMNVSQIENELGDAQISLQKYVIDKRALLIEKTRDDIADIEVILKLIKEQPKTKEEILNEGLERFDIKEEQLEDELSDMQDQLKKAVTQQRALKVAELQSNISLLEELIRIHSELNEIPNETDEESKEAQVQSVESTNFILEFGITQLKFAKGMPDCFEKCIIVLLYFVCLKQFGMPDDEFNETNVDAIIPTYIQTLFELATKEKVDSLAVIKTVRELENDLSTKQQIQILLHLVELVRPFNFQECFDLISQVDKAAKQIEGKQIILLLGSTGCGKSTTIHYLCGSEMKETSVNGLYHIEGVNVKNEDLKKVICSPFAKSETRFVAPININLKDLGQRRDEFLILVDTPGSEDTKSSEVDISNSFGVIKAISGATKVRPVIIFSYKNFGARYEKLKALLQFYGSMINNIKENIKKFTYIFTHVPKKESKRMKSVLENIETYLEPHEKNDQNLMSFIDDMIDKLADGRAVVLNPLEGKPLTLLSQIKGTDAISFPGEVFKAKVHLKSTTAVKEQIVSHQKSIMGALQRKDADLSQYKINELKQFSDIFPKEPYRDRLYDILKQISRNLTENFTNASQKFNKCMSISNTIELSDIEAYLNSFNYAQSLDKVQAANLVGELKAPSSEAFIANLENISNDTLQSLKEHDISKSCWSEYFKKLDLIVSKIPGSQGVKDRALKSYREAIETQNEKMMKCIGQIQSCDFSVEEQPRFIMQSSLMEEEIREIERNLPMHENCANILSSIISAQKKSSKMPGISKFLTDMLTSINDGLRQSLQAKVNKSLGDFNEELSPHTIFDIRKDQIQQLTGAINMLEAFKGSFSSFKNSLTQTINLILSDVIDKIKGVFTHISQNLQEYIQQQDMFSKIKQNYDQIMLLREIPQIQNSTNHIYYQILSVLQNMVQSKTNDVIKIIPQLLEREKREKKDQLIWRKLRDGVETVKELGWILENQSTFYSEMKRKLKQNLDILMTQLQEEIGDKSLSLEEIQTLRHVLKVNGEIRQIECITKLLDIQIESQQQTDWGKQIDEQVEIIKNGLISMKQGILSLAQIKKISIYLTFLKELKELRKFLDFKDQYNTLINDITEILESQNKLMKDWFMGNITFFEIAGKSMEIKDSEINANAQSVYSILKTVSELKTKYRSLYNIIISTDDEMADEINAALMKYFNDLSKLLQQSQDNHQLIFFQNLSILQALIRIDSALEADSKVFQPAYRVWLEKSAKTSGTIISKAQNVMSQGNYQEVLKLLEQQEKIGDIPSQQNVQMIKEDISKFITTSFNEIQVYTKNEQEQLNKQQADRLNSIADSLIKVQTVFSEKQIENKGQIPTQIDKLFARINNDLNMQLVDAKRYLNAKKYSQSKQQLVIINDILGCLNSFDHDEKIAKAIQDLKTEKKAIDELFENNITQALTQIQNAKSSDFYQLRPDLLIQNFRELIKFFTHDIDNINKIIELIYEKEFLEIEKKQKNKDENISKIYKEYLYLKDSAKFIPKEIYDKMEFSFNKFDKIFKDKMESQNAQLELLNQTQSIQSVIQKLGSRHKSLSGNKEFKNSVNQKFQTECGNTILLLKDVNQRNVNLVLNRYIIELRNYQDPKLQNILTQDSQSRYNEVIASLNQIITNVVNQLVGCFIDDAVHQPQENSQAQLKRQSSSDQWKQSSSPKLEIGELVGIFGEFASMNLSDKNVILKDIHPQFNHNCTDLNRNFSTYLQTQSKKFESAFQNRDQIKIVDIVDVLSVMKNVESIVGKFRQNQYLQNYFFREERGVQQFTYRGMCSKLGDLVLNVKKEVTEVELITKDSKHSELGRNNHLKQIQAKISFLAAAIDISNDIQYYKQEIDVKKIQSQCEEALVKAINRLVLESVSQAKDFGKRMSSDAYSKFRINYVHLKSIQEQFSFEKQKIRECINTIESSIDKKISDLAYLCSQAQNPKQMSESLTELQYIQENVLEYKDRISNNIKEIIGNYKKKTTSNPKAISDLALILKNSPEGGNIVSENKEFKGFELSVFNLHVARSNVGQVLSEISGTNINSDVLRSRYNVFNAKYQQLILLYLQPRYGLDGKRLDIDTSPIVTSISHCTDKFVKQWTAKQIDILPELLAYIFALWTLTNADYYFEVDESESQAQKQSYLLQPHAGQVISIFRILGIGYSKFNVAGAIKAVKNFFTSAGGSQSVYDNLVQIKTGEGKSITLAIVSIVFALHGFEVSCACYSEYLSLRDYESFEKIFNLLNLSDSIKYGTFNKICENYINKDGKIRDIILSKVIKGGKAVNRINNNVKPRILMIDEVDVFFSPDFYGAQYRPQTVVSGPPVEALIDFIWSNKANKQLLKLEEVKKSEHYVNCKQIFVDEYAGLLDEAIKDMVCDIRDYHLHEYVTQNGMIGYKDQDQISYTINYGYKTMWAYYHENQLGKIPAQTLQKNKVIGINCGEFSYAEIPLQFDMILGVTGTLSTLTDSEKSIIETEYGILNFTFSPSVYGDSRLIFNDRSDIQVYDDAGYFNGIRNNLQENIKPTKGERAVCIFFTSSKRLQEFYNWEGFRLYQDNCFILDEKLNIKEKENLVTRATYAGRITLATRAFGRGTDFICRDQAVLERGGVHVIQTFLSEQMSEEVQIIGRTARQGNQGSFAMILLDEDLKAFNINEKDVKRNKGDYKRMLDEMRNIQLKINQKNETDSLKQKKVAHNKSLSIVQEALNGVDEKEVISYLQQTNMGRSVQSVTKTLILIDATGSMSNMLGKTKNAIEKMFKEAQLILQKKGLDPKLFEIQFGFYRNYSSGPDQIFVHSGWDSNHQALSAYLSKINVGGGQGNEAVEIALQYANMEAEECKDTPIAQVFLIGDAPPNTLAEVQQRRGGDQKWVGCKFKTQAFYQTEVAKLKAKKIQIFTFYVDNYAKTSFTEIASQTGATCQFLDVNNEKQGQEMLIQLFVTEILRKVGENSGGRGEEFVQAYRSYRESA